MLIARQDGFPRSCSRALHAALPLRRYMQYRRCLGTDLHDRIDHLDAAIGLQPQTGPGSDGSWPRSTLATTVATGSGATTANA